MTRAEIGMFLMAMALMLMSFVSIGVWSRHDRELHELRYRVTMLERKGGQDG